MVRVRDRVSRRNGTGRKHPVRRMRRMRRMRRRRRMKGEDEETVGVGRVKSES